MTAAGPGSAASLMALAVRAALEAGQLLAGQHGRPAVVGTKSSPTDVVTELDQAAERLIRKRIGSERPDDAILGEEGGQTGEGAEVRWIVDPLDGTVNYLYGLPDWAVSIAAETGGLVVAGVVCVPRRDALYGAVLGCGAWRASLAAAAALGGATASRGEPAVLPPGAQALACTERVPLDRALIATGFGYQKMRRLAQGRVLSELLPRVRDIRRGGACAVDLCSLAAGNVDGYYERGVQDWDIAAGTLIAREAGAEVGGLNGEPPGPELTIGAGPGLFAELQGLLASLNAASDS